MWLVTVKLPGKGKHDKVAGMCPVSPTHRCTDILGAHHTVLVRMGVPEEVVRKQFEAEGQHITRIEEV